MMRFDSVDFPIIINTIPGIFDFLSDMSMFLKLSKVIARSMVSKDQMKTMLGNLYDFHYCEQQQLRLQFIVDKSKSRH